MYVCAKQSGVKASGAGMYFMEPDSHYSKTWWSNRWIGTEFLEPVYHYKTWIRTEGVGTNCWEPPTTTYYHLLPPTTTYHHLPPPTTTYSSSCSLSSRATESPSTVSRAPSTTVAGIQAVAAGLSTLLFVTHQSHVVASRDPQAHSVVRRPCVYHNAITICCIPISRRTPLVTHCSSFACISCCDTMG